MASILAMHTYTRQQFKSIQIIESAITGFI